MEETILIESFRWYPRATPEQLFAMTEAMLASDSKELLLLPDPTDTCLFKGVVLSKYYTPTLSDLVGVRGTEQIGAFQHLSISSISIRGFLNNLTRKMSSQQRTIAESAPSLDLFFQDDEKSPPCSPHTNIKQTLSLSALHFLKNKSPAQIEAELNGIIIGQSELTRSVADFLYYHALRQVHPQLPQRPLLIAGPSGSGKTEVWRAANRLYGDLFPIRIIDGSSMSCEGWSGNYKIDTYIDATMVNGGILVVDEFDKLTKPKHSSSGENISLDIQAEFLKLIEGEYRVTEKRKQTNMTSQKMGFVLVGAFESLRKEKNQRSTPKPGIGFCVSDCSGLPAPKQPRQPFTDEDLISYGIMPEIVGRIAAKCETLPLAEDAYIDIICGPNSRVALIRNILKEYGIEVSNLISRDEIRALAAASKTNQTGVRWVSAQVEARLLEAIRDQGVFPVRASAS